MTPKGFKHLKKYRSSKQIKILKNQEPPLCACDCGELAKWNKQGNRWNKYLRGHTGNGRSSKQIKILKNQEPPLCACGCGELAKWSKWERKYNKYSSELHAIVHNNNNKYRLSKKIQALKNQKPPLCTCGCGESVTWNKGKRKWNKYINKHWVKCPKYWKKVSQAMKKSFIDNPERREIASKVRSKIWANPEFKEKMRKILKKSRSSTKYKEECSNREKKKWANPEFKEKMRKILKEATSNPKCIKKKSGENSYQWKGGINSKNKYPNSPVWQYAKKYNMTFEKAAQEFREVCNDKIK
jgi:hypothetical protein